MSRTNLQTQPCNEPKTTRKPLRRLVATESAPRCRECRRVVGVANSRDSSPTGS